MESRRRQRCPSVFTQIQALIAVGLVITPVSLVNGSEMADKTELPTKDRALKGREEKMVVAGMGCFWGAERRLWRVPEVFSTQVGYSGGITPNPNYEEGCRVRPHFIRTNAQNTTARNRQEQKLAYGAQFYSLGYKQLANPPNPPHPPKTLGRSSLCSRSRLLSSLSLITRGDTLRDWLSEGENINT
ncbi:hypothetical protein JZ751_011399 [Albula glossodonta]|uniref:peptide-methionine (S)-S-oxide reductase n=1 Tax=Albula glossodonta TaxID=121402 RepID=A0A8T2N783_9TELE|nr:hypothetical protein JZ751_011399 [Albula glossodonta]